MLHSYLTKGQKVVVVRRGGRQGGGFLPVGCLVHVAVGKVIYRRLRWKLKTGPIKCGDPLAGGSSGFHSGLGGLYV